MHGISFLFLFFFIKEKTIDESLFFSFLFLTQTRFFAGVFSTRGWDQPASRIHTSPNHDHPAATWHIDRAHGYESVRVG